MDRVENHQALEVRGRGGGDMSAAGHSSSLDSVALRAKIAQGELYPVKALADAGRDKVQVKNPVRAMDVNFPRRTRLTEFQEPRVLIKEN